MLGGEPATEFAPCSSIEAHQLAGLGGLLLVDLFPAFIRDGEDPRATLERYFIAGDMHWNAAGPELVARHIAPLLRQQQDVPMKR